MWYFQCQHGEDECFGNRIHVSLYSNIISRRALINKLFYFEQNCFMDLYPKVEDHFQFLNCCMSDIRKGPLVIATYCSQLLNIELNPILDCANGNRGNELLYNMGVVTNNLIPKLNYVPWININDIHTSEDQNDAENKDLVELICRKYSVC
jgi:interferon gamma-inducible protein 30